MVNRKGQRFCNESANYDSVCTSYYAYDTVADDYANVPAWVIFDEQVRTKGPASASAGWSKDNMEEIKKGWIKKADSLTDLAKQTGINEQALAQTIDLYNQNAEQGKDPLFRRGEIQGNARRRETLGSPILRDAGLSWPLRHGGRVEDQSQGTGVESLRRSDQAPLCGRYDLPYGDRLLLSQRGNRDWAADGVRTPRGQGSRRGKTDLVTVIPPLLQTGGENAIRKGAQAFCLRPLSYLGKQREQYGQDKNIAGPVGSSFGDSLSPRRVAYRFGGRSRKTIPRR